MKIASAVPIHGSGHLEPVEFFLGQVKRVGADVVLVAHADQIARD